MDKRLLIALPLCFLILFGWRFLFGPEPGPATPATTAGAATANVAPGAPVSTDAQANPAAPSADAPAPPAEPELARVADSEERVATLDFGTPGRPGSFRAVFTNKGAGLLELRSAFYFDKAKLSEADRLDPKHWFPVLGTTELEGKDRPLSFALRSLPNSDPLRRAPLEEELWRMRVLEKDGVKEGVEFTLAPGTGVTFTKRFRFVPDVNRFVVELELANDLLATPPGPCTFDLTPVAWTVANSGDSYYHEPQAVAGSRQNARADIDVESIPRDPSGGELKGTLAPSTAGGIAFAGVHSKYFTVLVSPAKENPKTLVGTSWRKVKDPKATDLQNPWGQIVTDMQLELPLPAQGKRSKIVLDVYAGPKDPEALEAANPDLAALHDWDLGWVGWISKPLLFLLGIFHAMCSSWGVAIILLTLLVRVVLFPLNRRSQTAMGRYTAKMKRLQPKIEELKKRFERDPAKLRMEQGRLMQQEGAFPPLGGCLPMFLQIPVFFGLYRALGISFDLRQQPFLGWIHDLALPDQLAPLGINIWPFGMIDYLNILPPIMVALGIWQQRMMPTPADEQAARMQKMMLFMPIMMGVFLYNYAAGLSVYMITQSGLAIFEMKIIRKYWPIDDTEQPKKPSGFLAKMIALQEQAETQRRGRARAR